MYVGGNEDAESVITIYIGWNFEPRAECKTWW